MFVALLRFSGLLVRVTEVSNREVPDRFKFVSLNNQPWQVRSTFFHVNSNEPHYCPFVVSANKCSGSCTIDDPSAQKYVPYKLKNINIKLFN